MIANLAWVSFGYVAVGLGDQEASYHSGSKKVSEYLEKEADVLL